jgi:hypothetical protein
MDEEAYLDDIVHGVCGSIKRPDMIFPNYMY